MLLRNGTGNWRGPWRLGLGFHISQSCSDLSERALPFVHAVIRIGGVLRKRCTLWCGHRALLPPLFIPSCSLEDEIKDDEQDGKKGLYIHRQPAEWRISGSR